MTTPEHSCPGYLEIFVRIIVVAPSLRRAPFHGVTGLLHHSTTIKLLPLSNLIKYLYPSLSVLQDY